MHTRSTLCAGESLSLTIANPITHGQECGGGSEPPKQKRLKKNVQQFFRDFVYTPKLK